MGRVARNSPDILFPIRQSPKRNDEQRLDHIDTTQRRILDALEHLNDKCKRWISVHGHERDVLRHHEPAPSAGYPLRVASRRPTLMRSRRAAKLILGFSTAQALGLRRRMRRRRYESRSYLDR